MGAGFFPGGGVLKLVNRVLHEFQFNLKDPTVHAYLYNMIKSKARVLYRGLWAL